MSQSIRSEILEHLKELRIDGLPESWFEKELEAEEAKDELPREELPKEGLPKEGLMEQLAILNDKPRSAGMLLYDNFNLNELRNDALGCTRCRLCETRTNVVFGVGKTDSPLIAFVGEGPGADEDRTGEPFVGRAGQLLTSAIEKGLGMTRADVYICNVVKCRPPENRAPLPDEVEACTKYLYRQLKLVNPKVIITLGQPAQLAVSGVKEGITKLRGKWQKWENIPVMPTFHPAYLLRNPPAKKPFWEDLKEVMRHLGI